MITVLLSIVVTVLAINTGVMVYRHRSRLQHEHSWVVIGIDKLKVSDYGVSMIKTIVLEQCSCNKVQTRILKGDWTKSHLNGEMRQKELAASYRRSTEDLRELDASYSTDYTRPQERERTPVIISSDTESWCR